jgi:hypothetical protein
MKHVFWVCSFLFSIIVQTQDLPPLQAESRFISLSIPAPEIRPFIYTNIVDSSFLAFSNKYAQSQNINALMDEINLINNPESYHHLSEKSDFIK